MVTYDELFSFVIMLCTIITLVITIYEHKKLRPRPGQIRRYFYKTYLPVARHYLAFGSLVKHIITQYTYKINKKITVLVLPTLRRLIHPKMNHEYLLIYCIILGNSLQAKLQFVAGCIFYTLF